MTLFDHRTRSAWDAAARRPTLGSEFDPRRNSLDLMRLLLATTVAVVHASQIAYGHQPHLGQTELGALAVDAFFVLSGFLVARSFLQLRSVGRYLWHRALRILPAFWVCLVMTATLVAPAIAALEGRAADSVYPASFSYVVSNAALYMSDFAVAGLPSGTEMPHVVNGALWTLFYEAVCYLGVVALGVVGALTHRWWVVGVGIGVVLALLWGQALGIVPVAGALFLRFFLMFGLGTLALLVADRLPITRHWCLVATAVLAVSLALPLDYRLIGSLAFAYLCLYAVVRTPWLRHRPPADLSYGMYIYHWPIETLLVLAGATALTQVGYTILALGLATAAATASWLFVERPALARKDVTPSSRPRASRR